MKKSNTLQKQSEILASRIAEIGVKLSALHDALAAIDQAYTAEAGAEVLDPESLNALQVRRQAALTEQDILTRRVAILQGQCKEAECEEALARVAEIEVETEALAQQGQELLGRFRAALATALHVVEEALRLPLQQRTTLMHEALFLREKFDLPWPTLGEIHVPSADSEVRPLGEALKRLLRVGDSGDEWTRALHTLQSEREREARRQPRPLQNVQVSGQTRDDIGALRRQYEEQAQEHRERFLSPGVGNGERESQREPA